MKNSITFKTQNTWVTIWEKDNKIVKLQLKEGGSIGSSKLLKDTKKQIEEYLYMKSRTFDTPLELEGTELQKKVWNEIYKIPYGETLSYKDIAIKLNTSPRVVGNACGANKILLIIPCHRVLKTDGSLGGYSGQGGVEFKKWLLDMESIK